jgi:hypothetical protein
MKKSAYIAILAALAAIVFVGVYSTRSHATLRAESPNAQSLIGTTTNNNAAAGVVGEFQTCTVVVGSAVSLTTATAANVCSISLTAGDWTCAAQVDHNLAATTNVTQLNASISLTSATLAAQTGGSGLGTDPTATVNEAANVPAGLVTQSAGPVRVSLAATTTVFLVASDTFTVSTDAAYGTMSCRRAR